MNVTSIQEVADEAKGIVKEGIIYSFINLLVFSISYLVFTENLFNIFNPNPLVLSYGVSYIRIVFIGFIVLGHVFIYRGAFAGAGDTYPPMVAALVANVIVKLSASLLLTSVFKMGIVGVWIAITLSIFVESFIISLFYRTGRLYTKVIGNH
ncbi:hypothetical protein EZV73_13990 [Acidaminobacter sp. JC074]|nr:MATE family efflux transporter [Acidaminobacter sp. JC074]MCH4888700.1 hypothetical protein [Acidaminobacter sp. JC074]